jgi:hypothetical protein
MTTAQLEQMRENAIARYIARILQEAARGVENKDTERRLSEEVQWIDRQIALAA